MKKKIILPTIMLLSVSMMLAACDKESSNQSNGKDSSKSQQIKNQDKNSNEIEVNEGLLIQERDNILERYKTPKGYKRVDADESSFAFFLRHEKLKPYGQKAIYYDGREKDNEGVYDSVYDIDLGGKNLLHCADACYKFRADYLYNKGEYSKMRFRFVSGGIADFGKYTRGYRVDPESGEYFLMKDASTDREVYDDFLEVVYGYSGTLSLVEDTVPVEIDDMEIGDMFVRGGTPGTKRVGHAIMIVDMATNDKGEKIFMLAQSYMPAQQTQILVNPHNSEISPWYSLDEVKSMGELKTPQWTFKLDELRRFE